MSESEHKAELASSNKQEPNTNKDRARELFERVKNRLPKPTYIRTNDFKRLYGSNYLIERNEFGSAVYVLGKAFRKLQTKVEIEKALRDNKPVCQWGNRFFLYTRITPEFARPILEDIWRDEKKRGIPVPEFTKYDTDSFDI